MKTRIVCFVVIAFPLLFYAICPPGAHASRASWTVLIYMAGQNNLSSACVEDVLEMMEVGSTDEVNVIVQADTSAKYTPEISDGVTYRFRVLRHNVELFPLSENLDMAAPQTLSEFIRWGVENFPARRFALILWDHGLGWLGGEGDSRAVPRGILEDDASGSFMSMRELRDALSMAGVHFDLMEFDACLMAQAEVLGYVYDFADYMSFSENTEPGDGNPYDVILYGLTKEPDMDAKALGELIVNSFVDYYSRPPNNLTSVTKSLVRTGDVPGLLQMIDAFGLALGGWLQQDLNSVLQARAVTQAFPALKGSCDLLDFIKRLGENGVFMDEAAGLRDFYTKKVLVAERHFSSPYSLGPGVGSENVDGATGLAIDLPLPGEFSQDMLAQYVDACTEIGLSAWPDFVQSLLDMAEGYSAREVRGLFGVEAYWTDALGNPSMADLDLYMVEPSGVFAPWMGQTSPNGFFSADSKDSGKNFEIYVAREEVESGDYIPVINYYDNGLGGPQGAMCYLLYFPDISDSGYVAFGPNLMGLWNPAPAIWDDYVIYLLSMNFYSDWWVPTSFERLLSRAPIEVQRRFWSSVWAKRQMRRH